jgi:hypothetical protein
MSEHPSLYWIKFLLSRCEHTFDEVKAMCEMANLGPVENSYLTTVRGQVMADMPVPFRGNNLAHRPSVVYVRRQGIYDAWVRTPSMKEAIELLGEPRRRALVETFILSPLTPEQAVTRINREVNHGVSLEAYQLFQHYFWNSSLLNGKEWGEFIRRRRVAHQDWLQLAVKAQGPSGVHLLLWKTGVGTARHIDANKLFTHLRDIAYFKALELEHEPASKDHSTAFRNYVLSAKMAQEEATASATAMTDVLDSFRAFQLQTRSHQATTVDSLGGTISAPDEKVQLEAKES